MPRRPTILLARDPHDPDVLGPLLPSPVERVDAFEPRAGLAYDVGGPVPVNPGPRPAGPPGQILPPRSLPRRLDGLSQARVQLEKQRESPKEARVHNGVVPRQLIHVVHRLPDHDS